MPKMLLLCFSLLGFPAFAQVDLDVIERAQQLSRWLEKEDANLQPFARFHNQHQGQNAATREMTASLYLQACIKFADYPCALKRVEELLGLADDSDKIGQLLTLGIQLNYQAKQYKTALNHMRQWEQSHATMAGNTHEKATSHTTKQLAELYTIAAYSAYHLERWQAAEQYIQQALNHAASKTRYVFQLTVYQQAKSYRKEHQLLLKLTQRFPDDTKFWLRLAQNSLLIDKPKQAIAALLVLDEQKKLDEKQRILLAQLQIRENTPASAYATLTHHAASAENRDKINRLKLHALLLSRQRNEAIKLLDTMPLANSVATQAQLAYAEQQWQRAIPLLAKQMSLQPAQPRWRLFKAIAHFELNQYAQAKREFNALLDGQYATTAQQWLDQIHYLSDS